MGSGWLEAAAEPGQSGVGPDTGRVDAPILVKDSSAQNMTSSIQELSNSKDRAAIAQESDMGYTHFVLSASVATNWQWMPGEPENSKHLRRHQQNPAAAFTQWLSNLAGPQGGRSIKTLHVKIL